MIDLFGFHWEVGRTWGLAHPDHICYADEAMVNVAGDRTLRLGIHENPKEFHDKVYKYGVGYVRSVETVKYGVFEVEYRLPQGRNLWPAIWMYDAKTWPPEIDMVEAWSGKKGDYKKCCVMKEIVPCIHYGNNITVHKQRRGGVCGSIFPWVIKNNNAISKCKMEWTEKEVAIDYNGYTVMRCKDKEILRWLNEGNGMELHLNNYVTNDFKIDDIKGMWSNFEIYNLRWKQ